MARMKVYDIKSSASCSANALWKNLSPTIFSKKSVCSIQRTSAITSLSSHKMKAHNAKSNMIHSSHNMLSLFCVFCLVSLGSGEEHGHDIQLINASTKNNLRARLQEQDRLQKCLLDVDIQCIVKGKDQIGVNCDDFVPPVLASVQCTQTPISATMLLRGDRCQHSDLKVECQDHSISSRSSQEGDWLFIVATDAAGKGMTYHRDWVRVGEHYKLYNGLPLQHGIQIKTFDDDSGSNLLQTATYRESLCSTENELLALLGGSQIVDLKEADDNSVSPFHSSSYEVYIDVSISSQPSNVVGSIQLESLAVSTSFQGIIEFSEEAKGTVVEFGAIYQSRIPLTVDLLEKQNHSLLVQVTGNSGECVGAGFYRISDARSVSS